MAIVSPRKRISVFLDAELLEGLKAIKQRDLVPEAASIRQAIKEYLGRKGVDAKAGRQRVSPRRRP